MKFVLSSLLAAMLVVVLSNCLTRSGRAATAPSDGAQEQRLQGPSPSVSDRPLGHQKIRTVRITQLTGGYDPEGKPFINDTVPWGVQGVDLGANTEHNGRLYFFFGDVVPPGAVSWPPRDSDLIAYTEDVVPQANGFRLVPLLKNGVFYPFTVRFPNAPAEPIPLLRDDTPTGAVSYGGQVYVFFSWHDHSKPERPWFSSVASSPDPSRPEPFEWQANMCGKFAQVAPWVVRNSELKGLPSSSGDGLILFGQSGDGGANGAKNDSGGVFLAWVPLTPGLGPDFSQIRYWKNAADATRTWSANEADVQPLFTTRWDWSSLSVGRIPETGRWILLYQRTQRTARPEDAEQSIVARIAATPWAFFDKTEEGEIPIFNPIEDGAYRILAQDGQILNRGFMHRERSPVPDRLDRLPPTIGGNGFAYGAYLLNRYTRWDSTARILAIYYLMSSGTPYQIQLMRSQIRVAD
jgi:hypothetical protein